MATGITREFDEPFYGGEGGSGSTLVPNIGGSLVAINGRIYPIDNTGNRFSQVGIDVLQQRNTTDNRDVLLLPQNVWRTQIYSWNSGAGQSNMDRETSITSRYQDSFGIDPWTEWQLNLLPETLRMQEIAGTTFLTLHSGYLVVINDNDTYWWSDFGTLTATVTVGTSPIVAIADRGDVVTMLNSAGEIYTLDSPVGTPVLQYTNADAYMVAFEKDYLIVAVKNQLFNITAYATPVLIYTHPEPTFRWGSASSGPQSIYFAGGVGDRYVIHRVGIKDDGTGLNPAIVAAELPDGEIIYKIGSYLGFVFIGTNKGVRMAQPDNNGDLTLGSIIPTTEPVRCFEGQDRFMWFGVSRMAANYSEITFDPANVFPLTAVPGIGRMDLSKFTTGLLAPAYANDIAAWGEPAANVTSIATFMDKRVFVVEGAGVFFEGVDKVLGGWMTQGAMSFSVEDLKAALYMQANWVPSCSGSLYIDLAFDSSGYARYADLSVANSVRSSNINLNGTKFSRVNMRLVMTRCTVNNSKGPMPTRWEIRAFPVKGRASRWNVPVIIADDVDINGIMQSRNPVDDKNSLLGLIQDGTVFQYQESGQSYQVLARDFQWLPERLSTTGNGWQGTMLMVLEEVV
jgi:hypothetical protein